MSFKPYEIKKSVNFILLLQMSLVSVVYLFTKRGLSVDGAHDLIQMIAKESFYFLELSRQSAHFFQQLPSYLIIRYTSFSSLEFLTLFYSFGLIWIHILSFSGCFLILPHKKKQLIFFPLFFFITGPLTALGVSVSASLSVSSYIWLSSFVIYYSNLSKLSHQILFLIIPLPLLLSHEMLSYLAPFLIFLCILKLNNIKRSKKISLNNLTSQKFFIYFIMSYLILTCILSCFFLFFQNKSEISNRTEFFKSLFKLDFLFKRNEEGVLFIYPTTVTAGLALAFPFFDKFYPLSKTKQFLSYLFLFLLFAFACLCLLSPFNTLLPFFKLSNEEELRVWVSIFALPVSLLLWYLYESQTLQLSRNFFKAVLFTSLALTSWRIGSDYQFYKFQKQFAKQLESCYGIISIDESLKKRLSNLSGSLYHLSSYSLLFQNQIQSLFSIKPEMDLKASKLSLNEKRLEDSLFEERCYFGKKFYSMCHFFNLKKLNQSRFFNLNSLIQNIQDRESGCSPLFSGFP